MLKIHTQRNLIKYFFPNIKNGNGDNVNVKFIYIKNVMANYDMAHKCSQNHNFKDL